MACLRLKPTSDAPLAQGLPAKIIRLHRSGRRAKAHISMKPDYFRRQFPELAEGRCAFSGAWSPLSRWRKRRWAAFFCREVDLEMGLNTKHEQVGGSADASKTQKHRQVGGC